MSNDVMKFKEPEKNWFNCYEHLFYVSPMRNLKYLVMDEYRVFLNHKFYSDFYNK